jgi:sirohydrochlorin ferrochelatase
VAKDVPFIVKEAQEKHSEVQISISKPVGQHPKIKELFIDLINSSS